MLSIGVFKVQKIIAKPFVKWAGGKSQHLKIFESMFPRELAEGKIETYIEPFIGGGAVLFYILQHYDIKKAYINDINAELINCYKCIQFDMQAVIKSLSKLEENYLFNKNREACFYDIRERYNKTEIKNGLDFEKCAEFIFLNRTCFNGLYRVNKLGKFNVPHGRYKNPLICDKENLARCSELLQKVEICTGSYEQTFDKVEKGVFVYLDPPYRPLLKNKSFNSFDKSAFGDEEQIQLAKMLRKISNKGAFVMLSNSDPKNVDENDDFFDDLYQGFNIDRIFAKRMINCKGAMRGEVTEIVVRNFK